MKNKRRLLIAVLTPLLFAFGTIIGQAQTYSIGAPDPNIGSSGTFSSTVQYLLFDVLNPSGVLIESVDIYPTVGAGAAYTIIVQDASLATIATYSGNTTVASNTAETVPVNFVIPQGTGYRMGFSVNPGVLRNSSGGVYPYTVAGLMSITGHTFTSGPNYYYFFYNIQIKSPLPPIPEDAGIAGFTSPTSPVALAPVPVIAEIKNFGLSNLTSALIRWRIDGVMQTQKPFSGNLATDSTALVTLGTHTFSQGMHTIEAWTVFPNGVVDTNTGNDTATLEIVACNPLNGMYTVGATGDFPDIGTAIGAITLCGVSGPVTLNLENGIYNTQLLLTEVAGLSAANTLTIQSQSGNPADVEFFWTPTGSADMFTVFFDGADYITLQNMTLTTDPLGTVLYGAVIGMDNGANYNTIHNCILNGKPVTATTDFDYSIVRINGADDGNHNTFSNNTLNNGSYGFYCYGSSSGMLDGNTFTNNTITGFTYRGFYVGYNKNSSITGNTVVSSTNASSTLYGIYLYFSDSAHTIANNSFYLTGSTSVYGIDAYYCDGDASNTIDIYNNTISIDGGTSTLYGIRAYYGKYYNLYHNSVLINSGDGSSEYAFYATGTNPLSAVNNVFVNMTGGYAAYATTSVTAATIDYNNYYSTGTLGYFGTAIANLADWQALTGLDLNSVSVDPFFASPQDLTPASTPMDNKGTPIAMVTTDITGAARHATTPDMGAYEFTGTSSTLALVAGFVCDATQLVMPVTAMNFNNVAALSLALDVDTGYAYHSIQNIHPSLAGILANATAEQVKLSWLDLNATGVSIPDGLLFELVFDAVTPGVYSFNWDLSPDGCEITDPMGVALRMSYIGDEASITPCSDLDGKLSYYNVPALPPIPNTPMANVTISLMEGAKGEFANTTTDGSGNFSFADVPNGNYQLVASTTKNWGGVNAVDALEALKHSVGLTNLVNMSAVAADVNGVNNINATDALLISQRFVGQTSSFAIDDWQFEVPSFTLSTDTSINFFAICAGDANGSYQPAKAQASLQLVEAGNMSVSAGQQVRIPFSAANAMEVGAIALEIKLPQGFEVNEVGVNAPNGNLLWNQAGNDLILSWYSLDALNLSAGETMFSLSGSLPSVENARFALVNGSELANANAVVYNNAVITMPKLSTLEEIAALQVMNYPNPFSNSTRFEYFLPEDGQASLTIYDLSGAAVSVVFDRTHAAGSHTYLMERNSLSQGMYFYTLKQGSNSITGRMLIGK
jgi:parallel beta-helix repeat protein